MKQLTLTAVVAGLALSVALTSCNKKTETPATGGGDSTKAGASTAAMSPVERGKYLVTIGGCNDCHTPLKMGAKGPEPDMSRMLSGHPEAMHMPPMPMLPPPWGIAGAQTLTAWNGPWGTSYTANLTPDMETGIGKFSEADFIKCLRNGLMMGSNRPIMPPMPWQGIAQMTDDDLKAVYAFLKSIPPIKNKVPEYQPSMAPGGPGMPPGGPGMPPAPPAPKK